jgi:PAS domain S-box-containing protein
MKGFPKTFFMLEKKFKPNQPEFRTALRFGFFAILWIVLLDYLLFVLVHTTAQLSLWQTLNAVGFAALSAVLLFRSFARERLSREWAERRELEHLNEFQRFVGGTIEYAIFSLDADGLVRSWEADASRMHGFSSDHVLNKPVSECFVTQEVWKPESLLKQARVSGRASHLGWLTRQDGFRYWGQVIFDRVNLPNDQIAYTVMTRDLSGGREAARFTSMIETMTEGLIVIDRDWRFVFINSKGAKLLERDASDLIGKNIWAEFPLVLESDFGRACQKAMEQNISAIIDDPSSTSSRWLENRIYPSPDGILIFYSDVTEAHQIQEAIRMSEQRLRMILEFGQQGFFDIDLRTNTVITDMFSVASFENKANVQKTGVQQTLNDWLGQIYPEDQERVLEEYQAFIAKEIPEYWVEFRWQMTDGSWRWKLSQRAILEHDQTGRPIRMLGTYVDIQSSKEITQALLVSNRRYLNLMETSPVAIFEANSQGEIVYVNERWQEITSYNRLLALNQGWTTTLHPEDRSMVLEAWNEAIVQQKPYAQEYRFQHVDGTVRWVYGLAEPLKDLDGKVTGYLGSMVDLTSRKRAELELDQVRKRYQAIVTALPTPIVVFSPEGLVEEWNVAAEDLFGWQAQEVIGRFSPLVSSEDRDNLLNRINQTIDGHGLKGIETRPLRRDGSRIDTLLYNQVLPKTESKPAGSYIAVYIDMTERKRAEQKLEQSEKMFRLISENSSDVISLIDLQGIAQYVSPAVSQVLGYGVEEFLKITPADWVDVGDLPKLRKTRERLLRGESSFELDCYRARRKDGANIWLEVSARMVMNPITNQKDEIQTVTRDITKRIEIQQALEASEYLYRTITENAHDVTFVTNLDATILYASPSIKTLSGFEPEEMIQTPIMDYFHPDDLQEHMAKRQEAFEKGLDVFRSESRLRRKDGEYIWVESILKINRDKNGQVKELQVTSRNVTERIVAKAKLEANEHLYRNITENAHDVTFITSLDSTIQYVSPSAKTVLGFDPEEMKLTQAFGYFHPDDLESYSANRRIAIDNGLDVFQANARVRNKNGEYIWVEFVLKINRNSEGETTELQVTLRNITDRLIAQEKLEESERLYRTITENAHDVTIVSAIDGKIRYVSPSATSVFGYDKSEIDRVLGLDFIHPEDLSAYLGIRQQAIDKHREYFTAIFRVRHQNQSYIWVESVSKLIRDSNTGNVSEIQATVRDITERKTAQEALEQLNAELEQRIQDRTKRLNEVNLELESFTSSVSHDLRSPLNVIQGFGRAFLEDYSQTTPSEGQDFVQRIVGAAGRMDVLITDLLQYSRLSKAEITLTPIALESLLYDLIQEFESDKKHRNAVIALQGNFPKVLARETILRQVLINLVGNGLKFTRADQQPEITIWAELDYQTNTVKLHVRDNGIGIEAQNLERIFQPFERLHGVSEYPGSGIGLAFVKRGVERMGGQIGVTSILGKGSHFWLRLNQPWETS